MKIETIAVSGTYKIGADTDSLPFTIVAETEAEMMLLMDVWKILSKGLPPQSVQISLSNVHSDDPPAHLIFLGSKIP